MTLRVAIPINKYDHHMSGVLRYAYSLIRAISDRPEVPVDLSIIHGDRSYEARHWLEGLDEHIKRAAGIPASEREHVLSRTLRAAKPDVLHFPWGGRIPKDWLTASRRNIISLHGVAPLCGESWVPATWVENASHLREVVLTNIERIPKIITGSRFSRSFLVNKFGLPRSLIDVIHYGVDTNVFRRLDDTERAFTELSEKYDLQRPYLFFAGNPADPRKNVQTLLKALGRIRTDVSLVMTGNALTDELKAIRDAHRMQERIRLTGSVSEDDLVALYNCAEATVIPSHFEGFGFPILESMACGTPVVAAQSSAIEETAGEAALLVSAWNNPEAWVEAIESLRSSAALQQDLRTRGDRRALQFNWTVCAAKHLKVYEYVANLPARSHVI